MRVPTGLLLLNLPAWSSGFALGSTGSSPSSHFVPLGVEWTHRPSPTVDITPWCSPFQDAVNNSAVPIDDNGWPLADSYTICFDYRPAAQDPEQFTLDVRGTYYFTFHGKAQISTYSAPPINLTVLNTTFDQESWTTSGFLFLGGEPAFDIGFENTMRNASAPVGSGITDLFILQPGYSAEWLHDGGGRAWMHSRAAHSRDGGIGGNKKTRLNDTTGPHHAAHRGAVVVGEAAIEPAYMYTLDALLALQYFNHTRVMEWSKGNYNPGPYFRGGFLEWSHRSLVSDSLWSWDGYVRPNAHGAPWETVVRIAQSTLKSVWLNIPVSSSGFSSQNTTSYVYQMALLFRDGNAVTGNVGVPSGTTIYLEHSNEVWLNSSYQHAWNLAAAVDEVARGGSNLNNDGATEPLVWANRRHVRRVGEIGEIFSAVFAGTSVSIKPIFGQYQDLLVNASDALAWYSHTFGGVSAHMYGLAINCYSIAYAPVNTTLQDVYVGMLYASNMQLAPRTDASTLAAQYGLRLVSYEGAPVVIAYDNTTIGVVIEANRQQPIVDVFVNEVLNNWAPLAPVAGEYNYYALASAYGPAPTFTWGLTEDVRNLSTWKMAAVAYIQANQTAVEG